MDSIDNLMAKLKEAKAEKSPEERMTAGEVLKLAKARIKHVETVFGEAVANAPSEGLKMAFLLLKGVAIGNLVAITAWIRDMDPETPLVRQGQDFDSYSKMCAEEFDLESFKNRAERKKVADGLPSDEVLSEMLRGREANG